MGWLRDGFFRSNWDASNWFGTFPVQVDGLRTYYGAAVVNLCLVPFTDAPLGMGGVPCVDKNGTKYAIYLCETTDLSASSVRIKTTTGIKAIRLKT